MTRRLIWITVLAGALLVLGGAWFLTKFERVPVDHWTPPAKEARRNPLLALERFTAAMGRPLQRAESATFLDKLPAGGVLILDSQRRTYMTPARVEGLLAWVEKGGYLIAAPESAGVDDPLLAFFEVNCGCGSDNDAGDELPKGKGRPKLALKTVAVAVPGAARSFQVDFVPGLLTPGGRVPAWRVGAPGYADQMLHFAHGSGHVTMITGLYPHFDNRHIGHLDHAELLWTLLETYQPDRSRPFTLITRLATPSLTDWLLESAWTALAGGAVLIALWLWAVVPRFGEPRPEPAPGRRELGEHLAAVGRFVWRVGGLETWLEAAREPVRSRLALRHPGLLALPPAEQAAALADLTRRPATLIAAALHEPARSPLSFTQALRTLRALERIL